jgi:hypothetical protein
MRSYVTRHWKGSTLLQTPHSPEEQIKFQVILEHHSRLTNGYITILTNTLTPINSNNSCHSVKLLNGVCGASRGRLVGFVSLWKSHTVIEGQTFSRHASDCIISMQIEWESIRFKVYTCRSGLRMTRMCRYGKHLEICCFLSSVDLIELVGFIMLQTMSSRYPTVIELFIYAVNYT